MIVWQTIAVAFAMFSAVPVPQPVWNQKNMRYALCAFPLVGAVCALAWWGWAVASAHFSFPDLLRAAGLCLIPVFFTGGIHLDGYADTCDALASCASPEKKQEILKDPRCGAFALIRLCTYFIAYLGLCAAVRCTPRDALCMGLGFVLERALSGLAVAWFPLAKSTGLVHTFATAADRLAVRRDGAGGCTGLCAVSQNVPKRIWRHFRRFGRMVFAENGNLDAGGAGCLPDGRGVVI